ncbi:hypothetical protein [Parabacteroides sp. PF5-6]|uniref:hypothetical protein n=1 Tax=Parabacteroides sp. PF5-6 TaxID=1742403 RepID=UPI0024067156|nr:hypothetical protein [Parabacteroides sp. PF5-6]MDF9831554.1 hypothetical protein [Parabacteroides sp. PF5-6]
MINELDKEKLRAYIEHEKRNLLFYASFYDHLTEGLSKAGVEKRIDFHLDRLSDMLKKLKDNN